MAREIFVVVGAGQAGLQVCAALRGGGFGGRLILIGDENSLPYQRPPLSKEFLLGALEPERLLYRKKEYFEKLDIELMLDDAVENIDAAHCTVSLRSGDVLDYSKLALTTGARVRTLECDGADLPDVFYIRSIVDSLKLRQRLLTAGSVVVVGGGFVGLEAGAIARKMGKSVIILEAQERLMKRAISGELSKFYLALHTRMGSNVRLECDVSRFEKRQHGLSVVLKTGESINADIVLVGIGVIPNSEIAKSAGLQCDNGIRVDERCFTNDANIVSAGDCTMHQNQFLKKIIRLESVQNAVDQAKVAASSMLGGDLVYNQVPWFWSDQYDVKLQIAGVTTGYDSYVRLCGQNEDSFSFLYFKADAFLGADSINHPVMHMAVRKILQRGMASQTSLLKGLTVDEIIVFSKAKPTVPS
jgi:3-phenylpropionate/trans-cinnamate dioxygenase ferredoxin reductase subunit